MSIEALGLIDSEGVSKGQDVISEEDLVKERKEASSNRTRKLEMLHSASFWSSAEIERGSFREQCQ